jgi:hypothetical protein
MGEATRRKAEIERMRVINAEWQATLSPEQKTIASVAQTTYNKLVCEYGITEGCYILSFFLYEYLRRKHKFHVQIVVGWVNDGLWDGASSHAWVEYEGKKIDIALHKTSYPEQQPPGDLLILDHIFKRGKVCYKYFYSIPKEMMTALENKKASSELRVLIERKEQEHQRIQTLSKTPEGVNEYFRSAPSQCKYEVLADAID